MALKNLVAAVAISMMASGCLCATGNCGAEASVAENDLTRIESAANRAEEAAARAEAAALKAATASEKAEGMFHKGLRK